MRSGLEDVKHEYLRRLSYYGMEAFRRNLSKGPEAVPVLEHEWRIPIQIFFISDVDGVWTGKTHLCNAYFNALFRKRKYAKYSNEIEENERSIDRSPDDFQKYIGRTLRYLFDTGLTWEDHIEACNEASNVDVAPNSHEALKEMKDIPPYVGIGWNSTSWQEDLVLFSSKKCLGIQYIEGSCLEFREGRFTGRCNFNYGPNKIEGKDRMLSALGFLPNLEVSTVSDTILSDKHFRKFVGRGGIAFWADHTSKNETESPDIIEFNLPEMREDLRILPMAVKTAYRSRILTITSVPADMALTSLMAKKFVEAGEKCLKAGMTEFEYCLNEFISLYQPTLLQFSKFDFPRYSSGIDHQYSHLISCTETNSQRESVSKLLGIVKRNFPECLAEEGWLDDLV